MRSLHRVKALAAYNGAKEVIAKELSYPGYILIKEATRGLLSYMVEDFLDTDISDKTKLTRLMELLPEGSLNDEEINAVNSIISAENNGLDAITSFEIEKLNNIRSIIKKKMCIVLDIHL